MCHYFNGCGAALAGEVNKRHGRLRQLRRGPVVHWQTEFCSHRPDGADGGVGLAVNGVTCNVRCSDVCQFNQLRVGSRLPFPYVKGGAAHSARLQRFTQRKIVYHLAAR